MKREITGKELDKQALEVIKTLKSRGKCYEKCADALRAQGYRVLMGASGGAQVSKFAIDNGIRERSRQAGYARKITTDDTPSEDFMLDVLASKKLTKQQKLKVLTALMD